MKSDRRHELQTNELADWLGEHIAALQPHAGLITICVVGALLALVVGFSYFGGEDGAAAQSWSEYFSAFNQREPVKVLEQLATQRKGTPAAMWALQSTGDMNLAQGAGLLFSDRVEAKIVLEKAEKAYEQVAKETTDPVLRCRAELGLGKVHESLCDPAKAATHYTRAAEVQKSSAISKVAAEAAKRMQDERQVALLEWFVKQEPKRPAPLPGIGGPAPGMPGSIPDRPDIAPPSGLGLGNVGATTPTEPAPSFPAPASTATPSTEALKAESPKTDQPVGNEPKTAAPESPAPAPK